MKRSLLVVIVFLLMLTGCRTYYQREQEFHGHFRTGRLEEATQALEKSRDASRKRNQLLHLLNQGVVQHMLGNYARSNDLFEQAFILGEDYRKDFLNEALSLFTNPKMTEYRGEDFELLMVHYYKAMNFIQLGDLDAALVECRRLNIKLAALEDKYTSDNRYKRDAFIHNLMGIIYEASGDFNNAFIAYRNAYEIYRDDYSQIFGVEAPVQLKSDLIRAAYRTGFSDLGREYEELFGMQNPGIPAAGQGELVFFWQNGLGPVKEEWSINFSIIRGAGGSVQFVNEEMGLSFPFFSGGQSSGDIGDLRLVRVAFPKYAERSPVFAGARLVVSQQQAGLQLAQDVNAIAFKSLEDRMVRELSGALLRLAVKQAAEQSLRSKDDRLGAVFSILGAVTEQADTRNWQTLPHSIHYARMMLPEGENKLDLELLTAAQQVARKVPLEVTISPGRTTFRNFHSLDAQPPGAR